MTTQGLLTAWRDATRAAELAEAVEDGARSEFHEAERAARERHPG